MTVNIRRKQMIQNKRENVLQKYGARFNRVNIAK